jgi:hypothetical protein
LFGFYIKGCFKSFEKKNFTALSLTLDLKKFECDDKRIKKAKSVYDSVYYGSNRIINIVMKMKEYHENFG